MPKLRRLHAFLLCPAGSRIRASDRPRPMTSAKARDLRRGNRRRGRLGSLTLPLFTPSTSPNKVTQSKTNIKTRLQKLKNPAVATIVHAEVQFSITFQLLCLVSFRFPDFPAFLLIFGLAVLSAPIPGRVQDPRHETCFETTRSRDGAVTSAALAASRYRGHRPSEVTCPPRRGARPVSLETRPQVRTGCATPPRVVLA